MCSTITYHFGQSDLVTDSLFFHSRLEWKAFSLENEQLENQLTRLFAVNAGMTQYNVDKAKERLEAHFKLLEDKKILKKKPKKAMEIIFETTHDAFLEKYEYYAEFHQIFNNGVYNCVTASALYALIFDHFNIPYEIQELPEHVYVVAYPNSENIVVETTDPVNGIVKIDKEKYVKSLVRVKIISETEFATHSIEELYKTYGQQDEQKAIDLHQNIANLYYNAALLAIDFKEYYKAFALLKKVEHLTKKEGLEYTEMYIILGLIHESDLDEPESWKALFMALEYEDYQENVITDILNINIRMIENYLLEDYQPEKYQTNFKLLLSHLDKEKYPELYKDLMFDYYARTGASLLYQYDAEKALMYSDSAYQLKPNHLKLQYQIDVAIRVILEEYKHKENDLEEFHEFFQKLDDYIVRYPFLMNDETTREVIVYGLHIEFLIAFNQLDLEKAASKIEQMEQKAKELDISTDYIKNKIEHSYSEMYGHYLRKQEDDFAQMWLDKGLKKYPESDILLHDKELFDKYRADKEKYKDRF